MNIGLPSRFWLALLLNSLALGVVSILVAASVLPDNWIISPLYILGCSFAHRPLVRLESGELIALQIMTFLLFVFINWVLMTAILSFATI